MTDSSIPYGQSDNSNNLNATHEQTLSSIKKLQQMERSMYNQLDTSTGNKSLTETEQQQVINRINELSTMRTNLFQTLQEVYGLEAGAVSETRNDLVNQITTVGIVENELNNAKKTLTALENERYNKLRMVEINTYYGKRYGAQADIMKWVVILCIPLLILAILMSKQIISTNLGGGLISLVLIFGIIFIGRKVWDVSSRSNMNFDEFNWYWDAKSQDPTVYEYDKEQIEKWKDGAQDEIDEMESSFGNALGTCIGNSCCANGTKWDDEKHQCIEGFNKLSASAYGSRKEYVDVIQNNGTSVKPYTSSNNYSSV